MSDTVLLTGATGNLGAPLLATLLKRDDIRSVAVLVRARSQKEGMSRIEEALMLATGRSIDMTGQAKLQILCGDITEPYLGLRAMEYERLISSVSLIAHAAASTQFTLPIEAARQINCEGARQVFNLAHAAHERGTLHRVVYVSTAYVCGVRSGMIFENDSEFVAEFTNSYEQSKWETELMIHREFGDLPITIVRPSIVVGDSQSGRIVSCNVMYTPLRWIAQGRVTKFYCSPDTPLDVVSTDYVADAITCLLTKPQSSSDAVVHLTAGPGRCMTVGEIVESVLDMTGRPAGSRPIGIIWSPEEERPIGRPSPLNAYHPYMSITRHFDSQRRESLLDSAGISPRHLRDYLPNILRFCFDTDWRKRPITVLHDELRGRVCVA
ncbi:MAG: SDR family oxidoreductase [candidate division Zixibacteria bacterium]|nr:SDR family oxidoreductase [candidate division Zixibacteria bacterium]